MAYLSIQKVAQALLEGDNQLSAVRILPTNT